MFRSIGSSNLGLWRGFAAFVAVMLSTSPSVFGGAKILDVHSGLPDYDSRAEDAQPPSAQALSIVQSLGARASWNIFGTPSSLIKHGGYLATGQGGNPVTASKNWIRANKALFRLSDAGVDALELLNDSKMSGYDGHAVVFRQKFGSLPAGESGLITVGITGGKIALRVVFERGRPAPSRRRGSDADRRLDPLGDRRRPRRFRRRPLGHPGRKRLDDLRRAGPLGHAAGEARRLPDSHRRRAPGLRDHRARRPGWRGDGVHALRRRADRTDPVPPEPGPADPGTSGPRRASGLDLHRDVHGHAGPAGLRAVSRLRRARRDLLARRAGERGRRRKRHRPEALPERRGRGDRRHGDEPGSDPLRAGRRRHAGALPGPGLPLLGSDRAAAGAVQLRRDLHDERRRGDPDVPVPAEVEGLSAEPRALPGDRRYAPQALVLGEPGRGEPDPRLRERPSREERALQPRRAFPVGRELLHEPPDLHDDRQRRDHGRVLGQPAHACRALPARVQRPGVRVPLDECLEDGVLCPDGLYAPGQRHRRGRDEPFRHAQPPARLVVLPGLHRAQLQRAGKQLRQHGAGSVPGRPRARPRDRKLPGGRPHGRRADLSRPGQRQPDHAQ